MSPLVDNDRETAYVRIGNVTRPATREQLLMLGAASGAVHTEIMPVNCTSITSLDQARLENYLRDILEGKRLDKDYFNFLQVKLIKQPRSGLNYGI